MFGPGEKREFGVKRRFAVWNVVFFGFWAGVEVWFVVSRHPIEGYVLVGALLFTFAAASEASYLLRGPAVVTTDGVFVPTAARKDRYIEWRTVRSWKVEKLFIAGGLGLVGKRPFLEFTRADGGWSRYPISRIKDQEGFLALVDELVEAYGYRGL